MNSIPLVVPTVLTNEHMYNQHVHDFFVHKYTEPKYSTFTKQAVVHAHVLHAHVLASADLHILYSMYHAMNFHRWYHWWYVGEAAQGATQGPEKHSETWFTTSSYDDRRLVAWENM